VFKGTLHMDGINKTLSSKVINSTTSEGKDNVKVAVKLIHPHVESLIRVDMDLLGYVADWFDRNETLELLSVGDTCRQFAEMMREQLDLRVEASHLRKFVANFKNENWLVFPEPIDKFVCRNVLVETFVEGTPLKNIMEASPVTEELKRFKMKLSDLGTRAILKMLFFDNFIHGDLHPG
jgi:aarF domain-containing kinase